MKNLCKELGSLFLDFIRPDWFQLDILNKICLALNMVRKSIWRNSAMETELGKGLELMTIGAWEIAQEERVEKRN